MMDYETREFVDECLRRAAEDIKKNRDNPQITAKIERDVEIIRLNAQAALERLEAGQRQAYQSLRNKLYQKVV